MFIACVLLLLLAVAVTPLVHVVVHGLGHGGIHVPNVVVLAKLLEGMPGQHELDEQLRVADGEIEFDKGRVRLAAYPDVARQLVEGGAGVRAQACDRNGGLLDDFSIVQDEKVINILNAPSPAATSSLSIGKTVAEMALSRF